MVGLSNLQLLAFFFAKKGRLLETFNMLAVANQKKTMQKEVVLFLHIGSDLKKKGLVELIVPNISLPVGLISF